MAIVMESIIKSFGSPPVQILNGISGKIETSEMVAITGRSGSGKSTLLYIISTLDKTTAGKVEIDGVSLSEMSQKELHRFRNEKMGFVFQFHHLLSELTALENILMPAIKSGASTAKKDFALELLNEFGILNKADSLPSQLSGGEQQRVAIARALVMKPEYLFADEPTGNLDSQNGQLVMNLFRKINGERGTTIIYVTHDLEFSKLSTRQINLVDGRIV